jgi:predicted Ser/Thr protein kinase
MEGTRFGNCRLVRRIGAGGMGEVWLARHETLEKDVAIKLLPADFAREPEAVQRFLREARSAARLEHPNVVQVLDAGTGSDGAHFIVMQFVDGTDLDRILRKKGRFEVSDALAIAKKVAQALAAAHKLGIVHRDIKPANILLTKQSRVMVADFGLARDSGDASLTGEGHVLGTPQYLAPEQARGEPVDPRSDLYSLGGTLYAFLTGRPPYTGASPISIAVKHADPKLRPDPVRSIAPGVPPEVEALVEKLMAKKREDRYQTAEEVVAAIDRLKGAGAELKALTPSKQRRLVLGGAAAGVGGLILFVILLALLGPSKAEKALRAAGAARTEEERTVRYRDVLRQFPGTKSAQQAAREIEERFRKELAAVRSEDGRVPTAAFDALRARYPEHARAVDAPELAAHRARVLVRTDRLAGLLRSEKGEDHDRLTDFVPPESIRKNGEASIRFWLRVMLGLAFGQGTRLLEVDPRKDTLKVEARKTATVLARIVAGHRLRPAERKESLVVVEWTWMEDDWYLGEKAIREEK